MTDLLLLLACNAQLRHRYCFVNSCEGLEGGKDSSSMGSLLRNIITAFGAYGCCRRGWKHRVSWASRHFNRSRQWSDQPTLKTHSHSYAVYTCKAKECKGGTSAPPARVVRKDALTWCPNSCLCCGSCRHPWKQVSIPALSEVAVILPSTAQEVHVEHQQNMSGNLWEDTFGWNLLKTGFIPKGRGRQM